MSIFTWAVLMQLGFTPANALAPADTNLTPRGTSVTIVADVEGARVCIDSTLYGFTPLTIDTLRAGVHRLQLSHPDSTNWLTGNIHDTIEVTPGKPQVRRYHFERRFALTSIPSGAEVYVGDSVAGTTPLVFAAAPPADALILLKKKGYVTARTKESDFQRGFLIIPLKRDEGQSSDDEPGSGPSLQSSSSSLRLFICGGAAVVTGIAAVYFKTQADDRHDSYFTSQDPGLLAETSRLDRWAGISLAATELCMGLFTYFLMVE